MSGFAGGLSNPFIDKDDIGTPVQGMFASDGVDGKYYDGTAWIDLTIQTTSGAGGWTDEGDYIHNTTDADGVSIGADADPGADALHVTGAVKLIGSTSTFDFESYGSVGNGSAFSVDETLIINRAWTGAAGEDLSQLLVGGGAIIEAGSGTHSIISSVHIPTFAVTGGAGATTVAAGLYIGAAPTGAATTEYSIFVDAGNNRFDGNQFVNDGSGVVIGALAKETVDGTAAELQVLGTATADSSILLARYLANASQPTFDFLKSRATSVGGAAAAVVNNDRLGSIRFFGDDGTDNDTVSGRIEVRVDGTVGTGDVPAEMIFFAADGGVNVEGFRIKPNGDLILPNQLDVEGYMAVGNGSVLDDEFSLIIDRDHTTTSGEDTAQLFFGPSAVTVTGATTDAHVIDISIAAFTNGSTVTNGASLYITGAPTYSGTVTNGPYALWVKAGDTRIGAQLDVEGYMGIGNAAPFNADRTLYINRTFTISNGADDAAQLSVGNGTITEGGSGAHDVVACGRFNTFTYTGGAGSTTDLTTLYIGAAPTGTSTNGPYSLLCIGDAEFDANVTLTAGFVIASVSAGLTAGTTQTQAGGLALTKEVNEVSTVANTDDTVVLPTAAAGKECKIFNNGDNTLRIYPFSGDDLGTGVDTLTTLAAASNISFLAYDATNWETQ